MIKQITSFACTKCKKESSSEFHENYYDPKMVFPKPNLPTGWMYISEWSLYCDECADKIADFLLNFDVTKKKKKGETKT